MGQAHVDRAHMGRAHTGRALMDRGPMIMAITTGLKMAMAIAILRIDAIASHKTWGSKTSQEHPQEPQAKP